MAMRMMFRRAMQRPFEWLALLRVGFAPGTSTDVGSAIVYCVLFGTRLVVGAGRSAYDAWIEKRRPARWRVAEVRVRH